MDDRPLRHRRRVVQAPPIEDGAGKPLESFSPSSSELAGSIATDGSGALLGSVPGAIEPRELLLVRNPGQPFKETSVTPPLEKGERLFNGHRAPMVAALAEGGGVAGALVVPISTETDASEARVLHWDGTAWTSEPIEIRSPAGRKAASAYSRSGRAPPATPGCSRSCPRSLTPSRYSAGRATAPGTHGSRLLPPPENPPEHR